MFDHKRPPFVSVDLTYAPDKDVSGPQQAVMVNPRVLQYQTLVSLAQLKPHSTATVTLSLKNIAMSSRPWTTTATPSRRAWSSPAPIVLAADVVGARLLGFDLQAVRHLWEAQRLGLGETDISRLEFPGLSMQQAIEEFTAASGRRLTFSHA